MANIPIEVGTGETRTITFHTAGTFSTEDITFSITAAGGDENTTMSGVAYCNTAAATATKTATMPGFELVTGQRILLQTTNANSATSNVKLSVNGTTAKPIKIGTSNVTSSNFPAAWWIANYDGTNWVLTRVYLSDTNTDTMVTQSATTTENYRKILLGYNSSATTGDAITSTTNVAYEAVDVEVQPSTGKIISNGFVKKGGTSSQFLKADGSVDSNTYSLSSHNHSGVYKPIQTAVTSPTASTTTSTTFIDSISQNENGVITATKKTLPSYASSSHSHAFSSITSRGEAYLEWGGRNLASTYSPIDAAMVGNLGANRTAFVSPNAVTVEYSRDGGTTWTDYGASDLSKTGFFTDFKAAPIFYIGKSTSSNPADANCQLRVTLSTAGNQVYTILNKFIIYVTTSGSAGTWCSIDARLQSNVTSNIDTWKNFANRVSILGWSGYNVINTSGITTYGNAPSSQYGQVRFTFGCTGVSSSAHAGLGIYGVNCYGGVGWATPSTMASNGRLYSFDMSKNATFPAKITATQFVKSGGTSSQFLKADGSVDSNTYVTSPTSDITLSTSPQTYIISGSTERKIALPSTDPYTSARTPSSHKHGNIQNDGTLQATDITIANGDKLIVTDSSESNKVSRASITFDGSTTTKFLSQKGTWESPSSGGSTVTLPSSNITLSTTAANYITVDGTTRKIGLPTNAPTSWMGTTQTTFAKGDHLHGNIQSTGALQTTDVAIASGDKLVVTDSSDSNKIARTSLAFGTSTTTFLRNDGTWATPAGGGGGSTVTLPSGNITLSTTASTYITVDGTSRTIALPTSFPTSWIGVNEHTASRGNHGHGTISNGGYIQGNISQSGGVANNQVAIANGDRLVIGDYSDRSDNYHKLKLTSIVFDGSTTTQFLSKKGTWETPSGGSASMASPHNSLGTVLPLDSISSFDKSPNHMDYGLSTTNTVELLRIDYTKKDYIQFLLPICMDNLGHLYIPISEGFGTILMENGYTASH